MGATSEAAAEDGGEGVDRLRLRRKGVFQVATGVSAGNVAEVFGEGDRLTQTEEVLENLHLPLQLNLEISMQLKPEVSRS